MIERHHLGCERETWRRTHGPTWRLALMLIVSSVLVTASAVPASADQPPSYVGVFAGPGLASMYPVDIVSTSSRYYVVDPGGYRVVAVDRTSGAIVDQFGGHRGNSPTQIGAARAIAIDSIGNIYVADTANNRVVKLDPDLQYLTEWGGYGSGAGQFQQDFGITVGTGKGLGGGTAEVVYVTDGNPGRIQKFALDGTYISQFGAGVLNKPREVAVDPTSHKVFVVNATAKQVAIFNDNGTYLSSFGGPGTGTGQFKQDPRGIAVTSTGQVFVSDPGSARVQVWTTSGAYTCAFGSSGTGPGQFTDIRGLSVSSNGKLAITDEWDFSIHEFSVSNSVCPVVSFTRDLFGTPPAVGGVNSPRGMAVDASGRVFITDWWNQRIQRFNAGGGGAVAWGYRGTRTEVGALNFAWDVAIQPGTDRVFVANRESHEIEVFDANGAFVADWGKQGTALGQFKFPQGVAFAPNGDLLVTDSGNNRIQRCSIDAIGEGACYTSYGQAGSQPGQFKVPAEISIEADGTIWVADTQNNRVQKRSPSGVWTSIGIPTGGTKFKLPWGVTVAPDGSIWVADSGNDRIVKMQTDGTQLLAFSGTDVGAGAFDAPFDVAFTGTKILVSDTWNNRVVELQ